jgi:hypothetical protein
VQSLGAPNSAAASGQSAVQPPPEAGAALSQDFKHERVFPTSSNVTFPDAALNLSVPGIRTTIGIHGFSEGQIISDLTNGLNNNEFDIQVHNFNSNAGTVRPLEYGADRGLQW